MKLVPSISAVVWLCLVTTAVYAANEVCEVNEGNKLIPADSFAGEEFGQSISISGNRAVIGCQRDNERGQNAGAAYIYTFSNGVWIETAKLTANDGVANDFFGASVAISGDRVVVGADNYGHTTTQAGYGAAYMFLWNNGEWERDGQLIPLDFEYGDLFGSSVSISGNVVIIGAHQNDDFGNSSGSAYIYEWDDIFEVWRPTQKLLPNDPQEGAQFGSRVTLDGTTAVVAAYIDNVIGSAYVFERVNDNWLQTDKIIPNDGTPGDQFGVSVAVSGSTILVGANNANHNLMGPGVGAAYIFDRIGKAWTQAAKLYASDGLQADQFGYRVALDNDLAVISAPYRDDHGNLSGAAYLFKKQSGVWTEKVRFEPDDGAMGDFFGLDVALQGNTIIVGAFLDDHSSSVDAGSAYAFTASCHILGDLDNNGVVDVTDLFQLLAGWGDCREPCPPSCSADLNGDCDVNVADLFTLLSNWG